MEQVTIAEAISSAATRLERAGITNPRLDAELLLCHAAGRDRSWLIMHFQDELGSGVRSGYEVLLGRRGSREPLQYIIGRQEFRGLDFKVTPDVLIPRPETELVVEAALGIIKTRGLRAPVIVDLCTGSGCIAVSLAKETDNARVFATDTSSGALSIARENARNHAVSDRIRLLEGDLFGPLEELDILAKIDIITANPPYVRALELQGLQPEVRDFEPMNALVAGPEGTEIHKRIIEASPEFLRRGGALIMEMGLGQAESLVSMVNDTRRYGEPEILKDLAGIERVIAARKL